MIKKFLLKSIRPIGATLILVVAFLCLLSSEFYNQVDEDSFTKKLLDYTISFESSFYDYRMRKTISAHPQSQEVALIEIDDYSLSQFGQWPLNRTVYSDLLRKLSLFGARVVAFDILFPEKSPGEGADSPDQRLVRAFRDFRTTESQAFVVKFLLHAS